MSCSLNLIISESKTLFRRSLKSQVFNRDVTGSFIRVIWSEASVHIIFFWWRTGPYTAIWPSVPWTICFIWIFSYEMVRAPDNFIVDGVISPYSLEMGVLLFSAYLSKNLIKQYIKREFWKHCFVFLNNPYFEDWKDNS